MLGKLLLDTNAIVALLNGHEVLRKRLSESEWVGVSVISILEFMAFPNLGDEDRAVFTELISRLHVVHLAHTDLALMQAIQSIRQHRQLKLPDAIIAASAHSRHAVLVTEDQALIRAMESADWSAQSLTTPNDQ